MLEWASGVGRGIVMTVFLELAKFDLGVAFLLLLTLMSGGGKVGFILGLEFVLPAAAHSPSPDWGGFDVPGWRVEVVGWA